MRFASSTQRHLRRLALMALLAAGGFGMAPASAEGFQTHWCRGYASRAVADAKRNFSSNCGGTGDRWGMDFQGHLNWCADLPDEDGTGEYQRVAGGETRARSKLLKQCRAASIAPVPFVRPGAKPAKSNTKAVDGDCGPGWFESGGECYPKLN